MNILYKFPSRSRPEKFKATILNLISKITHEDYTICATLDSNDHTMNNESMIEWMKKIPKLIFDFGYSQSKIDAINRGMPNIAWDLLFLISDDIVITETGFDTSVIADMNGESDIVMHYPDGYEHGDILTLPIMDRKWYDRFGFIYNYAYKSLFADEEILFVAEKLGRLRKFKRLWYRHDHPAWVAGLHSDKLLIHTQSFHALDKSVFQRRKANNFFVK